MRGDIIANGLTILPPRKIIDYSDPTFPSAVWLLARPEAGVRPIKPSGNREEDIKTTKAMLKLGTTFVMDNSCLDPTLYDLEGKGYKLKRFTGSTNLNDIVPALLKHESDMTLLDVPDVMVAMERWSGPVMVIGPISEEQHMAAAFRKEDSPELRKAFNTFLAQIKQDGTYMKLVRNTSAPRRAICPSSSKICRPGPDLRHASQHRPAQAIPQKPDRGADLHRLRSGAVRA